MSGIEAISQFFENIRPRYSWSSSESITPEHNLQSSLTHDEEENDISSSPPSSLMSDVERQEILPLHDDERECAATQQFQEQSPAQLPSASVGVDPVIHGLSSTPNSPPIMSPSEGPSYASTRPSHANQSQNPHIYSVSQTPPNEANSSHASLAPPNQQLSEDDGHRQLREKVIEIQQMKISERERAIRMHKLMTEKYLASQAGLQRRSVSPSFSESGFDATNPFRVGPDDALPSYHDEALGLLGCEHYRRGVKIQCSSCARWYPCRFCHDEIEDHVLVRKDTKNMLCMHCGKAQPAQQSCRYCGKWTARYYCDKCKLWDDDPRKTIYHCNDCGICRIGMGLGKDFFHCKRCGVCMSIELEGQHRCIERSTDCDCPICGEYMFTSVMTVVFMNCGHSIHHKCYYEHMKNSYRCPTCARSVLNMETQFRFLDHEIARQPLPDPYKNWHCHITCNDCSAKSDVPFHFLGLKCSNCKSYNTCEVRLIRPEDESADPSMRNPLPPHLMPNPDMAATIMGNRVGVDGVVTDLASVIREIDMATMGNYPPEARVPVLTVAEDEGEDDEDDTRSCDTCSTDNESMHDSDCEGRENEEVNHEDDEDEEDDDEDLDGYEIIHLPFHP